MNDYKFRVDFLSDVKDFLDQLDEKAERIRDKYFNEKKKKK
jgi:hypothetical protein